MAHTYSAATSAEEIVKDLSNEVKGKVILTTGASPASLGVTFLQAVASAQPALLILAGRDVAKLQQAADLIHATCPQVPTRLLELDLASLAAVRKSAAELNSWTDVSHLDVVVNNAGIMATDYKLSADGFESQLATNHLGHFLFTNIILAKILASGSPRVVNISSDGHRLSPIRWADYNFSGGETYNRWRAYGQSKTANMLMALSLAAKLGPKKNLLAFSLHPGVIMTTTLGSHVDWSVERDDLRGFCINRCTFLLTPVPGAVDKLMGNAEGWAEFIVKSAEQGAATYVYAAFEPSLKGMLRLLRFLS